MARTHKAEPALITTARFGTSLDTSQRRRRYVWTTVVRIVCFVSGLFAPTPVNIVLLVIAAGLPGVAVLLANAVDHRTPPAPDDAGDDLRPALTSGEVVPGEVEQEPEPEQASSEREQG